MMMMLMMIHLGKEDETSRSSTQKVRTSEEQRRIKSTSQSDLLKKVAISLTGIQAKGGELPFCEEPLFVPTPMNRERVEQRGDQYRGDQVGAEPVPLEAAGGRDGSAIQARATLNSKKKSFRQ